MHPTSHVLFHLYGNTGPKHFSTLQKSLALLVLEINLTYFYKTVDA